MFISCIKCPISISKDSRLERKRKLEEQLHSKVSNDWKDLVKKSDEYMKQMQETNYNGKIVFYYNLTPHFCLVFSFIIIIISLPSEIYLVKKQKNSSMHGEYILLTE